MERKKRPRSEGETDVPSHELLRRQRQRELQKVALQVRAQGRDYNPHRAKARVYKHDNVNVVERPSQARKHGKAAAVDGAEFQVLVLPIFWNQRPDEKRRVLECCEHATQLLEAAGFTHHVDKSGHYTPGQKMRHWEEKGVKVRLEIGPKDAEQSICTIARSQPTPGLVAYKRPGDVNESLPEQVRGMLDMRDAEVPAGDISKYEKKTQAQQDESEERSHNKGSELHDADEEDTKRGAGAKQPVATGDALEDDFGSDLEIDDEEAALSAADKRRRQKRLDKERKKKRDAAAR